MKNMILPLAVLVSACSGNVETPADLPPPNQNGSLFCPVHSARDVQMWINAMPGPNDNPTLLTTFTATAPTPGYTFDLRVLEVRESFPPQYVFELVSTPPEGITTQVETPTDVRIEIPNFAYDQIALAIVKCGENVLFTMDSIETVY